MVKLLEEEWTECKSDVESAVFTLRRNQGIGQQAGLV